MIPLVEEFKLNNLNLIPPNKAKPGNYIYQKNMILLVIAKINKDKLLCKYKGRLFEIEL